MRKKNWFTFMVLAEVIAMATTLIFVSIDSVKGEPIPHNYKINLTDQKTWSLIFSDEFNGTTLDTTKWRIDDFESQNHLRRAAYYSKDTVSVNDGNLIIRTNYRENGSYGKGWYTGWVDTSKIAESNSLNNYEGFNSLGGYFEINAKAPDTVGIWSAFWMLPDTIGEDKSTTLNSALTGCEIDIMESPYKYLGSLSANRLTPVVHADEYYSTTKYNDDCVEEDGVYNYLKSYSSKSYYVPNMFTKFHRYGLEWNIGNDDDTSTTNDSYLSFYVDGWKIWTVTNDWAIRQLGNKTIKMMIPKVKEYLLLSVEVSGTNNNGVITPGGWSGNPEVNDKTKSYDYLVDYVRIYQRKTVV